jgi:hypothetical protein
MLKKCIILFSLILFVNPTNTQNILFNPIKHKNYFNNGSGSSLYPISIAAAAGLYLLNPILIYDDKTLYMGITKEFSIGFGYFGEHRLSFEYSFIVSGRIRHHIRTGYKYDILLKENIKPSNTLQGTGVISIGGGYFYDFDKQGAFPEISLGYSLRNHKLLIYPHVKLRHTFMFKKTESDITDLSFGFMFGIANPFIDLKIRNKY